jgi:hypothetical protein
VKIGQTFALKTMNKGVNINTKKEAKSASSEP